MTRIIVLDVTGVYTQIYDEVYCEEEKCKDVTKKYHEQSYLCIVLHVDSNDVSII